MKIEAISGALSLLAPRLFHTLRPHYGAI